MKRLLLGLLLPLSLQGGLPSLGEGTTALSPVEEARLGRQFLQHLRRQVPFVEDLEVQDYIATLGGKLASRAGGGPHHFFVVEDPQINAFAGPGGNIGVNTGLILATESEDELASVVAHEVAHIAQRHLHRTIAEMRRLALPLLAASLAAAVLASQNPSAAQAALIALQAGALQNRIDFTRKEEEEADTFGLRLLREAGFDPEGMPRLFQRLSQLAKLSPKPPPFLQSHPLPAERFVRSYLERGRSPGRSPSLRYELIKAKLTLRSLPEAQAEARFKSDLLSSDPTRRAAARYGLALLDLKRGRLEEGYRKLLALVERYPYQVELLSALARSELPRDPSAALERYRKALELFPGHRLLELLYAESLLKAGRSGEARRLLERWREMAEEWPFLHKMLARAAAGEGDLVEANLELAHYHYALGELDRAIALLKAALKEDPPERERLERLLEAWKEERRWFR